MARVISTATGHEVARVEHGKSVDGAAFSPDGRFLATASHDGTARLMSATTWQELARVTHNEIIWGVQFSSDSRFLAMWGLADPTGVVARLVSTETGQEVTSIRHSDRLSAMSFSPDGKFLVTASDDGTAALVATADGREVARLVHPGKVYKVIFSPDSWYLTTHVDTLSGDGLVRLFTTANGEELVRLPKAHAFIFSPDSSTLARAKADGTVYLSSAPHGFEHARIVRSSSINGIVWNPNGRTLAARDDKGVVHLAAVPSGDVFTTLKHPDPPLIQVVFSRDGRFLATAQSVAHLVATSTGQELAQTTCTTPCSLVHFSHDENFAAFGSLGHWFRFVSLSLRSAFMPLFESRRPHGARSHGPEFLKPLPELDGS